jgi:hypothetical protein
MFLSESEGESKGNAKIERCDLAAAKAKGREEGGDSVVGNEIAHGETFVLYAGTGSNDEISRCFDKFASCQYAIIDCD